VDVTYLTAKRVIHLCRTPPTRLRRRDAAGRLGFTVVGLGTITVVNWRRGPGSLASGTWASSPDITDYYLAVDEAMGVCRPELVSGTQIGASQCKTGWGCPAP